MSLKLKNRKQLTRYLITYAARIERALIFNLEILVAQLENHAKLNAGYEDQTSNLKGSIGGVVLQDGRPITYRGFNSSGTEGRTTGLEFINSKIGEYKKGFVILIVAGMEYATYVENFHGLNVLKKSELKMQAEFPKMLKRLKLMIK